MVEKESLNLINVLQNPSRHFMGDELAISKAFNIDAKNIARWIAYEDRFSIANFSGLTGKGLTEIANALTVINMQGGVTSAFIDGLNKIPRDKVVRIYYKYQSDREKTYGRETYAMVCHWLKDNAYICELEFNRLLSYKIDELKQKAQLDEFNHQLLQNEFRNYAQEYWNDT